MASQTSRTLGLIATALGVLNIFSSWYSSYVDTPSIEDFWKYSYSYDGISIITSGVFTNPDSLLYHMVSDSTGIFMPILCSTLFCVMFMRFYVKNDRPYFMDVLILSILIAFASAYMMVWGHWGEIDTIYGLEHHGYGGGPVWALVCAGAGTLFAYLLDEKNRQTIIQTQVVSRPMEPVEEHHQKLESIYYDMYCPECGNGVKKIDGEMPKFCQHCGTDLSRFREN